MKYYFWLTLRLIRKQKLRSASIFWGILLSCFLLEAFGSFGYDFWIQVHEGSGKDAEFDSTQAILILLAAVFLLLILSCSAVLLNSLCSLTFSRRWKSLSRLLALGADSRGMMMITLTETFLLCAAASPMGILPALGLVRRIGVSYPAPGWMPAGIFAEVLLISCICSARPLLAALNASGPQPKKRRRPGKFRQPGKLRQPGKFCQPGKLRRPKSPTAQGRLDRRLCFPLFMAKKYRKANRGPHLRAAATILAAILLYVPAGYLIEANIAAQQSRLEETYGIRYNCNPQTQAELAASLKECRRLAASCEPEEAVIFVTFDTMAAVKTDDVSRELRRSLKEAGWQESPVLSLDASLLFLENPSSPACLINRYTNRSSWREDKDTVFFETPLLNEGASLSDVEIYSGFTEDFEPEKTSALSPVSLTEEIPEGIDFTGRLTLVLPLSRLDTICSSRADYGRIHVQGKFIDRTEETFSRLENMLGNRSFGRLTYTRKALLEWYASMKGIHQAMNALCLTLFFLAALNIFSMTVFHYIERKRGLAILWSLGQSPADLFQIMALEYVYSFGTAFLWGIPLSAVLCYYIYRIFRRAWSVPFTLPGRQLLVILVSGLILSAAALMINRCLMKCQDFLANIKNPL